MEGEVAFEMIFRFFAEELQQARSSSFREESVTDEGRAEATRTENSSMAAYTQKEKVLGSFTRRILSIGATNCRTLYCLYSAGIYQYCLVLQNLRSLRKNYKLLCSVKKLTFLVPPLMKM